MASLGNSEVLGVNCTAQHHQTLVLMVMLSMYEEVGQVETGKLELVEGEKDAAPLQPRLFLPTATRSNADHSLKSVNFILIVVGFLSMTFIVSPFKIISWLVC